MAKQVSRNSFLLKKNNGLSSGKSASFLLALLVHPVKLGGKKQSATWLPTLKSDHQHWKNKDSRKSSLAAIPWTCVHLKTTAFSGNVPAGEIQPTQFHILSAESSHGKSDLIRDLATSWHSGCHTTDGDFWEISLAWFQHAKHLCERQ